MRLPILPNRSTSKLLSPTLRLSLRAIIAWPLGERSAGRRWAAALTHDLDVVDHWPAFTLLRLTELTRRGHVGLSLEVAGAALGSILRDPVARAVDEAERMVFDLSQRRTTDSIESLRDLIGPSLERIEELAQRSSRITGVASGYTDLDEILAGLQPAARGLGLAQGLPVSRAL